LTTARVLKQRSPGEIGQWVVRRGFGRATAPWRLMPDFLLIGAQRAGTTSLFRYLSRHPDVYPSFPKEVHFFTNYYQMGEGWYRSHFPLAWRRRMASRRGHPTFRTGEATPYYLAYPHTPRRASQLLPGARLIVLLRDPVDRAYSHYQHEVAGGIETLSFAIAVDSEGERLDAELSRIAADDTYRSFNYQHFSYLDRGIYAPQIKRWFDYFARERLLILTSEALSARPAQTLIEVFRFLGLRAWPVDCTRRYNQSKANTMDPAMKQRLIEYFRPHNQQLYDLLGVDFGWEADGQK
jgi:hypothetical protein